MNVLILGSGGREHALAKKIAESKELTKLFVAPGNAGTMQHGENINLNINDFSKINDFIVNKKIDMIVVGPEAPLVSGIHDYLAEKSLKNLKIIGTQKSGAILEGSKNFAKEFMNRHNIPTARHFTVENENYLQGIEFLKTLNKPYVLKADGLASGKGVIIHENFDEACKTLNEMLNGKFKEASQKVVIEEFLDGIEVSAFILTDGNSYVILPEAKDYKRIGEGNTGLNTGGMGAISPVPFFGESFRQKVEEQIIRPSIEGLKKENIEYSGFLFFGLMNVAGNPYLIEYNARMGDPEAEVVIPRIKTDILQLFEAVAEKNLENVKPEIDHRKACTVMLVSKGYPEKFENGKEISFTDEITESILYHAGTKNIDDKIYTNGGRVIAVTSLAETQEIALLKSYQNIEKIHFENKYFRSDIGFDLK